MTFTSSNEISIEHIEKNAITDGLTLTPKWGKETTIFENELVALREYFQHEEKLKAQPWLDAKPGDVWVLTYGGRPTAHVYTERHPECWRYAFVSDRAIVDPMDPDITAGEKIWEEE